MTRLDALFVLRGRPGLGHVTPGLAIAQALAGRGVRVGVASYDNGWRLLAGADLPSGIAARFELPVRPAYEDWPGLDLYDHGVRHVAPILEESGARLLVLGGEYVMAPIGPTLGVATAMIFNPEIMDDQPRNHVPSGLFCRLFAHCDFLVPMEPPGPAGTQIAPFQPLRDRLTPSGPFCLRGGTGGPEGRLFVVANGGGVSFPARTASYSSSGATPARWLDQTRDMTRRAVEELHARLGPGDGLRVFSALPEADNAALAARFAGPEVGIGPPSLGYYDALDAADVVVSRAGSGFIADARRCRAKVVLWVLEGHDEQLRNACALAERRPATWLARTEAELARALAEAVAAPDGRPPGEPLAENAARLAAYWIERIPGLAGGT